MLSPRFCTAEQHGIQGPKYRAIDDLSRSYVNSTADTADTYFSLDMDALVARIRTLAKLGASDFKARSVAFPNAYRTIWIRESPKNAPTVCFVNPHTNAPNKARIIVQPFGISHSPENWGLVAFFIQFLAMELLTLMVGAFADDVYCAVPTHLATSGFWASKRLAGLLGFPTSDKKDQPPITNLALLGALISIGKEPFCASARPDRISKISGHIAQALQTNFPHTSCG